jgi:DNA polymerase-3 subunit gamma/tau
LVNGHATAPTPSEIPKSKSTPKTVQLSGLLKTQVKTDTTSIGNLTETILNEPFTPEALHDAWMAFAEQRKKLQAEFQMLSQPYDLKGNHVTIQLLSPVHETMLNNIRLELTAFLREKLRNSAIQVSGQLPTGDEKKVIYTNREKFDFLADKNPMLKELKDRLGLDTDF